MLICGSAEEYTVKERLGTPGLKKEQANFFIRETHWILRFVLSAARIWNR